MATGSFNLTKSANNSSGSYIIGKIDWSSTKNIEGNYSSVTATLYCKKLHDSMVLTQTTGGTWPYTLNINGSVLSGSVKKDILSDWVAMATHTVQVSHNPDGAKTITISGSVSAPSGTSYAGLTTSGSKSVALDTIPRASAVSATNADIGFNTTIAINRASPSFTHTLEYSFEGTSGIIINETASTSVSWMVPAAFYSKLRNAKSGTCTITCTTWNGVTVVGQSTCTFVATANENICKPTLTPTYVDTNATTVALTGSNTKFVQYYSTAQLATGAAARNGATLASQKITCGGKATDAGTATIPNVDSPTFVFSATDSRGYTTTQTINATMIAYVPLTCVVKKESATVDGDVTLKVSGNCYNGNFGAKVNSLKLYYRVRGNGSSLWSSSVEITNITKSGHTYTATFTYKVPDYRKGYVFQIRAVDELATVNSAELPIKISPVFDWGENDFNFNVPVHFNAGMTMAPVDAAAVIDGDGNGKIPMIYIVEQGVSGGWTYRKWNDGMAEMWGICKTTLANGSVLSGRLTYPFLLTGTVYAVGTINSAGGNGAAALPWNLKITYGLDLCEAWIHNPGTVGFTQSSTIDVSVHVVGRWK